MNKYILAVLVFCALITSCSNSKQPYANASSGEESTNRLGNRHDGSDTASMNCHEPLTEDEGTEAMRGLEGGHEWVDLGLPSGTRWATCNLGAEKKTEYGKRYSWGENHAKDVFNWDNCEMYKVAVDKRPTCISALMDYDPATSEWGSGWSTPTTADFEEMIEHTKDNKTWITIDGVVGLHLVGPNGNAIFLPAAGYQDDQTVDGLNAHGSYWTANRSAGSKYVDYIALDCWGLHKSHSRIDHGRSIRPVLKKSNSPSQ